MLSDLVIVDKDNKQINFEVVSLSALHYDEIKVTCILTGRYDMKLMCYFPPK